MHSREEFALSYKPCVMVYAEDDPDVGPPPWELLGTAGEVVRADDSACPAGEIRYLAGQRAAVAGTGSIGRAIAAGLSSLGVRVEIVGRPGRAGTTRGSDRLAEVARDADILVLALPLTAETTGLVDSAVLDALGPAGFLVNVGRGRSVVESDLSGALRAGAISRLALDVFVA